MIFVTVGSDIPFNRLLKAVDGWARDNKRRDVFAQIGRGGWEPGFIPFATMLEPAEFRERLSACRLVVGHAGMGTILSALQCSKPILVMPRRGPLGETRNDHQMDTARQLQAMGRVNVAFDETELFDHLDRMEELLPKEPIAPFAEPELIRTLHDFIHHRTRQ
ncbi:MAG: glycosyltransferase [Luteolibacter sp.]|jgi:UDP-N-acetylglucosamine transferase subunit ALG13|nr:glycosyltransferase [Luteolibacter sp.]